MIFHVFCSDTVFFLDSTVNIHTEDPNSVVSKCLFPERNSVANMYLVPWIVDGTTFSIGNTETSQTLAGPNMA